MGWAATAPPGRRLFLAVVALSLAIALAVALTGGAGAYPPALTAAATAFQSAMGPGGSGLQFDVVQRQTVDAKPDGPLIPIPDPSDPTQVVGTTDHLYVNSVLARGAVAPGAFWMEMRLGPALESGPAVFDTAPFLWAVIYQPPNLWRNDGYGWYPDTVSPGVGMDPTTAAKLPLALKSLTSISDLGVETLAGVSVHRYTASVDVANFPGVIASDGASFTETPFPVDLWLDSSNRLVQIEAKARNLNEPDYLLLVDTVITFTWAAPGAVPEPVPTAGPSPHPAL